MIKKLENKELNDNELNNVAGGTTQGTNQEVNVTYHGWCVKCRKSFEVPKEKIENINFNGNHNDFDPNEISCTGDVIISDNGLVLQKAISFFTNKNIRALPSNI